ncbi:hypothetical protein AgCh_004575 [Apium graveolens]
MGWSHPYISLDDLIKLIKGFVDILILASGYQSTGDFAHWDSNNIKNAFKWAIFFENGLEQLSFTTLGRAREFVLEHLIRALPLREAHLRALMTEIIEVDLDDISRVESDPLNIYLDELMLKCATNMLVKISSIDPSMFALS